MKKITNSKEGTKPARELRYFSEAARREIVKEIEKGLSKAEASRKYKVSLATIFKWISKYSTTYEKPLVNVVEHESDSLRAKRLEAELQQVYGILGRTKAEVVLLEEIIKKAGESYEVDLKKNFATSPSLPSFKEKKPSV